jgi:SAM-dependent methyltransferase
MPGSWRQTRTRRARQAARQGGGKGPLRAGRSAATSTWRSCRYPSVPWDMIWAEGSAYIIGVERAMRDWRRLLRPGGVLVFSEMVWRTDAPRMRSARLLGLGIPGMTRVRGPARAGEARRLPRARPFRHGAEAMDSYYQPAGGARRRPRGASGGQPASSTICAARSPCSRPATRVRSFEMFVLQKP